MWLLICGQNSLFKCFPVTPLDRFIAMVTVGPGHLQAGTRGKVPTAGQEEDWLRALCHQNSFQDSEQKFSDQFPLLIH